MQKMPRCAVAANDQGPGQSLEFVVQGRRVSQSAAADDEYCLVQEKILFYEQLLIIANGEKRPWAFTFCGRKIYYNKRQKANGFLTAKR